MARLLRLAHFMHLTRFGWVLASCLWLTSCGFQLQVAPALPSALTALYFKSFAPYDPLTLRLREAFDYAQVTITRQAKQAPLTFELMDAVFTDHLQTISANTLVRTYVLYYTVHFQLLRKGKVIYGPITLVTQTHYALNDNQLLGDNNVVQQRRQQLIQQMVRHIFYRLNANQVKRIL